MSGNKASRKQDSFEDILEMEDDYKYEYPNTDLPVLTDDVPARSPFIELYRKEEAANKANKANKK